MSQQTQHTKQQAKPNPDPYRWHALATVLVLVLTIPATLAIVSKGLPKKPPHQWAEVALRIGELPAKISFGESAYRANCALCHGKTADGVARLGKPLRNSSYVQEHSDSELFSLIATGRLPSDPENTTGSAMPPRANRGMTDDNIHTVLAYLRAIQDPTQPTVSVEEWVIDTIDITELVAGSDGIGHELFIASCSACHGASGEGMDGLGKPLSSSLFIDSKTNDELISFIKSGRPIWDAENSSGIDMPPKGGNPAITDEQLLDIVEYIRNLHSNDEGG